jgi:cation transport ATPase
MLEVDDHLHPLLKLGILRLHMVLRVDNPMGTGLHLLTGDVEQYAGVVPSMLGVTKVMANLL